LYEHTKNVSKLFDQFVSIYFYAINMSVSHVYVNFDYLEFLFTSHDYIPIAGACT